MLRLEGVSLDIDGRRLVDDIDLRLRGGEIVALLGPSGSGKTTLLRLIAGFEAPSHGQVLIHGRPASTPGRVLLAPERRGLALSLQDATLFPHLDAIGNVMLGLPAGPRGARRQRAVELLAAMGLRALEGRAVGSLSGGEAQRVALARALARCDQASLLLLDEPFGNVDRLTRIDLIARLREFLAQQGQRMAALLITHDPADAGELGARVQLMRAGRLVDAQEVWSRQFLGL